MRKGQGGFTFHNESKITPIKAVLIGSFFTFVYLLVLFLSIFFCSYLCVYRGKGVNLCEYGQELKEDVKIVFCCKNANKREVKELNRQKTKRNTIARAKTSVKEEKKEKAKEEIKETVDQAGSLKKSVTIAAPARKERNPSEVPSL